MYGCYSSLYSFNHRAEQYVLFTRTNSIVLKRYLKVPFHGKIINVETVLCTLAGNYQKHLTNPLLEYNY